MDAVSSEDFREHVCGFNKKFSGQILL